MSPPNGNLTNDYTKNFLKIESRAHIHEICIKLVSNHRCFEIQKYFSHVASDRNMFSNESFGAHSYMKGLFRVLNCPLPCHERQIDVTGHSCSKKIPAGTRHKIWGDRQHCQRIDDSRK